MILTTAQCSQSSSIYMYTEKHLTTYRGFSRLTADFPPETLQGWEKQRTITQVLKENANPEYLTKQSFHNYVQME